MTDLRASPEAPARRRMPDRPAAYVARDRRHALATGRPLDGPVRGTALFADLCGFTRLTETLRSALGPQRGPEELTRHLDRIFHAAIDALHAYGGEVIYFSGDAITAWLDGDDGARGAAAALGMQAALREQGPVHVDQRTQVQVGMKVALAVGTAHRAVVGDPGVQRIDVLAGGLLDALARAERSAGAGDVVLDPSAAAALGDRVRVRAGPGGEDGCVRLEALVDTVRERPSPDPPTPSADAVREWLLPVVHERLTAGDGELLAELRPAFPVFLRFPDLDFDRDEQALSRLEELVARTQQVFRSYGGNVLQLTLGDKGAYLYGVFGAPVAHEDDGARAATAAVDLLQRGDLALQRRMRIGIAYGPLWSGTYGHADRRTFVCIGDAVNLAARLMNLAPEGAALVSEAVRASAGEPFRWQALAPVHLKGKADPIRPARLVLSDPRTRRRRPRYTTPLVGRRGELHGMREALEDALAGRGRVVGLTARAGLGKSRLAAEFLNESRSRGLYTVFGECPGFGLNTSYLPWREPWQRLLGIDADAPPDAQVAAARAALERIDPTLRPRLPLLGPLLGLEIPDTELTRSFDAKLRKASLEDLLVTCLRVRAAEEPVVLVLEDAHWMDDLSRDLLERLARATLRSRVLLLVVYRTPDPGERGPAPSSLGTFREIALDRLDEASIRTLLAARARELRPEGRTPGPLVIDAIVRRAEGNPFFAEELLAWVAHEPSATGAGARTRDLPDSVQALIRSRIDELPETPRRVLKVASVLGRSFDPQVLGRAYPELGTPPALHDALAALRRIDLLAPDPAQETGYQFRHVVTQEVAYGSIPFAIRATLHRRVGLLIEGTERADLDLLAHHFWHSDDEDRKRRYLKDAAASARRRYANATAIDFGERLIPLLEGTEKAAELLELGKVLELTGEWERADRVARDAMAIAVWRQDRAWQGRSAAALAEIARRQGRYDEASAHLAEAAAHFRSADDDAGLGVTLHLSGTVAAQQGDFETARRAYDESLGIRERLGDRSALASLHSNLAIIAEYAGDYGAAREANERALAIRTELGDRWAIAVSQNNLGMIALHEERYEEARQRFQESMRLNREVGDPWMVAVSHDNLGNACRGLGELDTARTHYAESLRAYRGYDDQWALAFLLEDIAVLAAEAGDPHTALHLLGAADALREAIGSPRSDALEAELLGRLRSADVDPAHPEAADRRREGATWRPSRTIETALAYLEAETVTA